MRFIPKVGDKCYVTHPKGNSDCEILGISGGYVWFKVFNHVCFSFLMAECEFKPIKSPAEIEREGMRNTLIDNMRITQEEAATASDILTSAGYRKQQVKPLSKSYATDELNMTATLYHDLVDMEFIIQGGDK